ncbi:MAG: hypothetical protein RMJ37_00690 [Spirochaetia bacterium]|nr:hypothetical protein [Spirochaetota bacterium]MCX8096044.1 hypothetical protein [Spirochaetota bacterium]MDW8111839.1 hypothetical protein [Spirochaetia bacterium]
MNEIVFVIVMIIANSVFWVATHFLCGFLVHLVPNEFYTVKNFMFKKRWWEFEGKLYERAFLIKLWKDRLPEAGELLGINPFNKKNFKSRDEEYIERFILETCRAELAHILPFIFLPISFIWNNVLWAMLVMTGFCVVINTPFIAIQRYNRIRLVKILNSIKFH